MTDNQFNFAIHAGAFVLIVLAINIYAAIGAA
jgi:hypothetical protein